MGKIPKRFLNIVRINQLPVTDPWIFFLIIWLWLYSTTQNCRNFKEIESSRRVHKRLMPIMKYSGRCDQWNVCSSYVHTITRRKKIQNVLPLFFPCKVSLPWCPLVSYKCLSLRCLSRLWTLHLNYHMRLNGRTTTFWPAFSLFM